MNCKGPYFELRRKILFDHLEKFKDIPSRTIAKILARDYPEYFEDIEMARRIIRLYRGKLGKQHREATKKNQYYQDV